MAGYYERVGILRNFQNDPTDRSENALKSEAETVITTSINATERILQYILDFIDFFKNNWQLSIVGVISIILLLKRT